MIWGGKKKTNILQWNCRGIKANYEEIEHLIIDYKPNTVCLQESDNISFEGYDIYSKTNRSTTSNRSISGSSILIKK